MILDEEDKQIIDMLDKKDKEHVIKLIKEVDVLYDVLSHMEAISTDFRLISIDDKDKESVTEIKFRIYERRDLLEKEISTILSNFWKNTIRKAKRERREIYKNLGSSGKMI